MGRLLRVMVALGLVALVWLVVVMWPTDDTPESPDAVVVLGGGGPERTDLGIELWEEHGGVLVLSSSSRYYAARQNVSCDDDQVMCFEPNPPTTIGEARNTAELAADEGWSHVTVATSSFHTSRSRVVFEQCLGDEAVSVVGAPDPDGPAFVLRRELRETIGLIASVTIERAC